MKIWDKIKWEWANRYWKNTRQKKLARCKKYCQINGAYKWAFGSRDSWKSVLFKDGYRRAKNGDKR